MRTWAASIERLVLFEAGTEAKGFTPAPFKSPTVMISHAAPSWDRMFDIEPLSPPANW